MLRIKFCNNLNAIDKQLLEDVFGYVHFVAGQLSKHLLNESLVLQGYGHQHCQ